MILSGNNDSYLQKENNNPNILCYKMADVYYEIILLGSGWLSLASLFREINI